MICRLQTAAMCVIAGDVGEAVSLDSLDSAAIDTD